MFFSPKGQTHFWVLNELQLFLKKTDYGCALPVDAGKYRPSAESITHLRVTKREKVLSTIRTSRWVKPTSV